MKKLSLILMLASLFVLALAISVSAAEIPEWTDVVELDGMADKTVFGADGTKGATSRVLMSDGKTYPAYYICKNQTTLGISFTDINKAAGTSYAAANVVRMEIPKGTVTVSDAMKVSNGYKNLTTVVIPEGATSISDYGFKSVNTTTHSSLVSVTIPSTVQSIGMEAFHCCNSLQELVIPEGVEALGNKFAYYATSLKTVKFPSTLKSIGDSAFRSADLSDGIVLPEGLTTIMSYAFKGSQATYVAVPSTLETMGEQLFKECPNLKTVVCKCPAIQKEMFSTCPSIESITLENTVTIGSDAFYSKVATPLKSLTLPQTLTSIGSLAFARVGIEELVVPASIVEIGGEAFKECKSLKRVVYFASALGINMFYNCTAMTEIVITSNFEAYGSGALTGVSQTTFTTFYTGEDYERVKTLMSGLTRVSQAKFSSYEAYSAGTHTQNKYMFIYGANLCEVAFESHLEDNNLCVINCERCGVNGVAEKNPVHNEIVTMIYNGFDMEGERASVCTNEGCQYKVAEKAPALFNYLGHSTPVFDTEGGIVLGYVLNSKAIEEYESVTGKALTYGVFAVGEKKLNGGDVLNADGTLADGVLGTKTSGCGFDAFILKITGFTTNEQKNAKLVFGAYVVSQDSEGMEFSFMQLGTPSAEQKYYSVSYNDIIG